MDNINKLITSLENTPYSLELLFKQIPSNRILENRIQNKWNIHEQICHLVDAQRILIERFRKFEIEENPLIKTYNPLENKPENYYLSLNLKNELENFKNLRKEMITMLNGYDSNYWEKTGEHELFSPYSTKLLLIHALNVDYVHLFSIEQLAFTKDEFSNNIITIP